MPSAADDRRELDDFALAALLVTRAGQLAAQMRHDGQLDTARKTSVSDVVTAADHAAEALIHELLAAARPGDGLIGEEGANRPARRTWYADPVDGTYNFASGLPEWCSAVALVDDGQPALGAIFQPESDELWLGGPGRSLTCNGVGVAPLADRQLHEISIATYVHPETLPTDAIRLPLLRAIRPAATVRMLGSGSIELAAVAAGRIGVFLQHSCLPWDWLPGSTLVRAAGGRVEVFEHGGITWHTAGPPSAVAEILDLIRAD